MKYFSGNVWLRNTFCHNFIQQLVKSYLNESFSCLSTKFLYTFHMLDLMLYTNNEGNKGITFLLLFYMNHKLK